MNYEELSKTVEWETFVAATIEQVDMAFLSTETFTEADSRIKSCTDYKLLQNEADSLITLGYHLRNPSTWVSNLITNEDLSEDLESRRIKAQDAEVAMWKAFEASLLSKWMDKEDLAEEAAKSPIQCPSKFPDPMNMKRPEIWVCYFDAIRRTLEQESGWVKALIEQFTEDERLDAEEETVDSLWEKITPTISAWKSDRKGQGVGHASKTMFIEAIKCFSNDFTKEIPRQMLIFSRDCLIP